MDTDKNRAMDEAVATQSSYSDRCVAAPDVSDFASAVRQQILEMRQQNSDVKQQMTELAQQMSQQNSDMTQQMSTLSRQVHSMLNSLMLQTEVHQQMTLKDQHCNSLIAIDMQQATAAERQSLMDDTWQRVHVAAAVADIGAPHPADDGTKHNAAVPHQTSTMQSAVEHTRTADDLLLKRLEQLANSER